MSDSEEDQSIEAQYAAIRKMMAGKTVINRVRLLMILLMMIRS